MEVVVLGSSGISANSILSIRAGSTRRQATVETINKPFRFPYKPEECAALKLDIYDQVGSARTVCHAGHAAQYLKIESKKEIPGVISMVQHEEMAVTFKVQPATGDTSIGTNIHPAHVENKKLISAKTDKYLEQHNIVNFLQAILQGLIKEQPRDPYHFIARHFYAEARRLEPQEPDEVSELKRQLQAAQVEQERLRAELASARTELQEARKPPDDPRDEIFGKLLAGAENGQLERLLAEALSPPISEKCAEIFEKADSNKDGVLDKQEFSAAFEAGIFSEAFDVEGVTKRITQEQAEGTNLRATIQGLNYKLSTLVTENEELKGLLEHGGFQEDSKDSLEDVRAMARDILTSSLSTGDLERALAGIEATRMGEEDESPPPKPDAEITPEEEVRKVAASILLESAGNGELIRALEATRGAQPVEPEVEVLRQRARMLLVDSVANGVLQSALNEISASTKVQEFPIEKIRTTARDVLANGLRSGELTRALKATGLDAEADMLAQKARDTLLRANLDGSLKIALEQVGAQYKEGLLAKKARETLVQANVDGRLQAVMETLCKSQVPTVWEQAPSVGTWLGRTPGQFAGGPLRNEDLPILKIRATAREILAQGLASGQLAEAVQEIFQANNLASITDKAREVLIQANLDGSLEDAVSKLIFSQDTATRRRRAFDTLTRAHGDGSLEKALRFRALKVKAHEALTSANLDGRLGNVLEQLTQSNEVDEIRQKARATLTKASMEGNLHVALDRFLASQEEEDGAAEELRVMASDTIKKGLMTGDLARILSKTGDTGPDPDAEKLRLRAQQDLCNALRSGMLESKLAAKNTVITDANDIEGGGEVLRLYDGAKGRVMQRTTTDVFLKLDSGAEVWCAVEDLGQKAVLTVPHEIEEGEQAIYRPDRSKGTVLARTTTDVCVRKEDGTEKWHPIEDLAQVLPQGQDVREGEYAVRARDGVKGMVLQRTTTDVRIKLDSGAEVWEGAEDIAKAPPTYLKKRASMDNQAMQKAVLKPVPEEPPRAAPPPSPLVQNEFKDYYNKYMCQPWHVTHFFERVHSRFPQQEPKPAPPAPPAAAVAPVAPVAPVAQPQVQAAIGRLHQLLEELARERGQLMSQVQDISNKIVEASQENNALREQVLSRPVSREVKEKFGL